jgi:hypothetical protein
VPRRLDKTTNFPIAAPFQGSNGGGTDAFLSKIDVNTEPPVFTGLSPHTGRSSTDEITTSQNITISGTSAVNAFITICRADVDILGTTTAKS